MLPHHGCRQTSRPLPTRRHVSSIPTSLTELRHQLAKQPDLKPVILTNLVSHPPELGTKILPPPNLFASPLWPEPPVMGSRQESALEKRAGIVDNRIRTTAALP